MKNEEIKFKHFIQQIRNKSERLSIMLMEDIPESLPLIENPNGNDPSFNHAPTDFPGIFSFPSTLPDCLAPEQIIEELESIIIFVRIIVEDLYPKDLRNNETTLTIQSQFNNIRSTLDTFVELLNEFKTDLTNNRSTRPSTIIDIKALRELGNKLIRIGWEYTLSNILPIELRSDDNNIVHNIHQIQKINASISPQIEQFKSTSYYNKFDEREINKFFKNLHLKK